MGRSVYWLIWWLAAPFLVVASLVHPSLRYRWRERWGFSLPGVEPGALWVHAASLGEGRAAAAIFEALRPSRQVVFLRTASSMAGINAAKGQEVVAALPLDAPWVVRRWLDRVRPRALVLIESEIWPNLLLGCQARGIPVLLLGARRGRGQRRFQRWLPGLYRRCMDAVTWCSCTTPEDAEFYKALGVETVVAGDLKLDAPFQAPPVSLLRPWWVGASTHEPEEERLLSAQAQIQSEQPLTLVLAPRRLSRLGEVERAARHAGLRVCRLSDVQGEVDTDVLLVDRLGILNAFFQGAQAAYVGGTGTVNTPAHSPAEPAAAGLPLIAGPHRDTHSGVWAGCTFQVADGDLHTALRWSLGVDKNSIQPLKGGVEAVLPALLRASSGPVPTEGLERLFLLPVSWVWRLLTALRNASWSIRRPKTVELPVISVGSLGSGGTGKTVVSILLAREVEALGHKVTVLARGYRRGPGPSLRHSEDGVASTFLGDELAMMARRGIEVVSGPDRVASAQLAKKRGASVVVLDDGFQHRSIERDLDVVVIDGEWPRSGGPMPVGTEREGPKALARADVIWLHGGALEDSLAHRLPAHALRVRGSFHPVCWMSGDRALELSELKGVQVCAFAGIGRPGRFLAMLVGLGVEVVQWRAFADHHEFCAEDIEALRSWAKQHTLVCTEKDRIRLPEDFPVLALRVEMRIDEGAGELREVLKRVVGE